MLDPAFIVSPPSILSLFVPLFQNYLLKVLILLLLVYIQTANLIPSTL